MVASLAGALALGQIFGFKSMRNTASTFAVLYFTMKISVIPLAEDMVAVKVLGAFAILYTVALYSRTHPTLVSGLVNPDGLFAPTNNNYGKG